MDVLNAFVAFLNFVFVPGLAYGSQLALGALGVTLIFGVLRFSNVEQETPIQEIWAYHVDAGAEPEGSDHRQPGGLADAEHLQWLCIEHRRHERLALALAGMGEDNIAGNLTDALLRAQAVRPTTPAVSYT